MARYVCGLVSRELTLLLGGIDLKQTKTRNWYRKRVLEGENIEKEAGKLALNFC
jgi:hypothetical protein